jgi:hypothetical protein
MASAHTVVDPSTHSGQSHSLAVIRALIPWLEADPLHKVQFWYVPSQARWDNHGEVHKYVTSTTGKVAVTPATCATLNFCREKSSAQNLDCWDNMFNDPKYRGSNFLHLWGKEGKMPQPSSYKGGKWLQAFGSDVRLCARASRAILDHAPIGAYCQRFHMGDHNYWCHCREDTQLGVMGTLETRCYVIPYVTSYKFYLMSDSFMTKQDLVRFHFLGSMTNLSLVISSIYRTTLRPGHRVN